MAAPRILGANSPRQPIGSKVCGWHYDYVLNIGALANGATLQQAELPILLGAPFCLRGIGGYNIAAGTFVTSQLNGAYIEYTDSFDNWLQTNLVGTGFAANQVGDWLTGGQNAQYEPVYNQVVYGPNAVISVRITNNSGGNWDNAFLIFRGTKLYYDDRIDTFCYPKCYTTTPFERVQNFTVPALSTLQNQIIEIDNSDFVLRGGVMIGTNVNALQVRLKDQNEHPYSSDFVHWQWLFSSFLAHRPGVWYPEIYLPKDRTLLIDFLQPQNAIATANIAFNGQRIWPK